MSDSQLEGLIAEYLRSQGHGQLTEKLFSGQVQPENSSQLKERLRNQFVEWASQRGNHQPAPSQLSRTESGTAGFNQQPIFVGFLGDDLEYICSSYLEDELREAELYDQDGQEESGESKQLSDLLEWKRNFNEFVESKIPLPDHNNERRYDVVEKMRHRVPVSSHRLPSSIMYTVLNPVHSINSIQMVYDVGSGDSVIRLFDLKSPIDQSPEEEGRFKRRRFEDENPFSNGHLPSTNHSAEPTTDRPIKEGNFENVIFRGHTKSVTSTSWFEEDGVFLSSSLDGTIRLWSENLRANVCTFKGHLYPVLDVDACPVGYYFLSGSMDSSARLWCTENMEPIRICVGHEEAAVEKVKWHPGCSYFGSSSSDGMLRLWDVSVPKYVRAFKKSPKVSTSFCFGADGISLLCGFDDGSLEVVDLRKSSEIMTVLKAHEGPIWDIASSRGNGNLISTGGRDGSVKLWSLPDRKCTKSYKTRSCHILSTFWTFSNLLITTGVPSVVT